MTGKSNIAQITPEPLLVGAAEAARLLGIGRRLLWSITNRGDVPHIRLGRRVLYDMEDLRAFIKARKRNGLYRR